MNRTLWMLVALSIAPLHPASADGLSRTDATSHLLNALHRANQKEIKMGQLAQEKGVTLQVRSLGEALVRDSHNANQALVLMAKKEGVALDPLVRVPYRDQRGLRFLTGPSFDKAFAQELIKEHSKEIHTLLSTNHSPIPENVQELVMNWVPTLEKHLAWAQTIQG